MNTRPRTRFVWFAIAAALLLAGCIERKETLVIHPDGGVDIDIEYRADSEAELYDGDAVPTLGRGWFVVESVEQRDDDRETFILTAEADFDPGEALPADYAAVRDPYPDTNLQFPTDVTFEQRRDGVYCHFRRTYQPRPWAYLDQPRRQLTEHARQLEDTQPRNLSPAQRLELLNLIARFETMKIAGFARAAFDDVAPDAPQDLWLRMRRDILDAVESFDSRRLAELFAGDDDERNAAELEREERKLEQAALDAMRVVLSDTHWFGAGATGSFMDRYDRHKRYYAITEDLGDDAFEITVEMPGEIIAHNADDIAGNRVTWKFPGSFLRDNAHELMVTSRLPQ